MRHSLANRRNNSPLRSTLRQPLNSLNRNNRVDVFNLNLTSASSFRASLTRISSKAKVDLELVDRGNIVAVSRPTGKNSAAIAVGHLDAGRYRLRVILKSGQKNKYRLSFSSAPLTGLVLNAEPLFDPLPFQQDLGAASPAMAKDWGTIGAAPVVIKDSLSRGDEVDWYSFTVGEGGMPASRLKLALTSDAGVYARLYSAADLTDSLGSVLADSGSINPFSHADIAIGAGNYFVKVAPLKADSKANYSLNLSASGIADTAGNTQDTARVINNLQPLQLGEAFSSTDFVGHGDIADYYMFRTDAKTNLTIKFERLSSSNLNKTRIQYQLEQVDGSSVIPYWRTAQGISLKSSIDALVNSLYTSSGELEPGTYILQLRSYFHDGDNSYRMTFSTSKP